MRFNVRFTPEPACDAYRARCTPTINHAPPAFIENKRYPSKPPGIGGVVNRGGFDFNW
jgi:hypothetical protein